MVPRTSAVVITLLLAVSDVGAGPIEDLARLCDEYWQGHLKAHPVAATTIGDRRYDDRLEDITPAGLAKEKARLEDVLRAVGFCKVHVFSYSPREGTAAAALRGTVPPPVVARRRERLREIEQEMADEYRRSLVGRVLDVLVEGAAEARSGFVRGTSCRYVPVTFRGHLPALIRRRVPVRVVSREGDLLLGEPEPGGTSAEVSPGAAVGRLPLSLLA